MLSFYGQPTGQGFDYFFILLEATIYARIITAVRAGLGGRRGRNNVLLSELV